MTLVRASFSEYYDELTAREYTIEDQLKDLNREEVGERRNIENEEIASFADVLHIAGVWIGEKKKRESGKMPKMDKFEMALYEKQHAVWFPAAPPRAVAPPTRPLRKAFPLAAFKKMCKEESELRCWLYGVESRLREHIDSACAKSWYVLTCFEGLMSDEQRGRSRILHDESEIFAKMRRSVFLLAPPDYFRKLAVDMYGHLLPKTIEYKVELTIFEEEEMERKKIEQEWEKGMENVVHYLFDAYETQLFIVNHEEIVERLEIQEEYSNALYPMISSLCRDEFGVLYYQTLSVGMHCSRNCPTLRHLSMLHINEIKEREARAMDDYNEAQRINAEGKVVAYEATLTKDEYVAAEEKRSTELDDNSNKTPSTCSNTILSLPQTAGKDVAESEDNKAKLSTTVPTSNDDTKTNLKIAITGNDTSNKVEGKNASPTFITNNQHEHIATNQETELSTSVDAEQLRPSSQQSYGSDQYTSPKTLLKTYPCAQGFNGDNSNKQPNFNRKKSSNSHVTILQEPILMTSIKKNSFHAFMSDDDDDYNE